MTSYISMREITQKDYEEFARENDKVVIENIEIKLRKKWRINNYSPPKDYVLERETVWSFPDRGDWATHVGDYRGNWSPYISRNLILKYTNPGDQVLDQN